MLFKFIIISYINITYCNAAFQYNMNILQHFVRLRLDATHSNKFYIYIILYLKVECGCKDLHSGVFGGSVHEAMTDLIALMGK